MIKEAIQALGQIKTENDILKLIIIGVISIPLLMLYIKTRSSEKHARHKEQMEKDAESRKREEQFIGIISANTAAFVELSTLLKSNNQNCTECRAEQTQLYRDVLVKQETIHNDVIKIKERL